MVDFFFSLSKYSQKKLKESPEFSLDFCFKHSKATMSYFISLSPHMRLIMVQNSFRNSGIAL